MMLWWEHVCIDHRAAITAAVLTPITCLKLTNTQECDIFSRMLTWAWLIQDDREADDIWEKVDEFMDDRRRDRQRRNL